MIRSININEIIHGWFNHIKDELGMLDKQTKEIAEKRIKVCEICLHRQANQCGKCGCFIPSKAASPNSKCPENKW